MIFRRDTVTKPNTRLHETAHSLRSFAAREAGRWTPKGRMTLYGEIAPSNISDIEEEDTMPKREQW
jgi:hypothetical protein